MHTGEMQAFEKMRKVKLWTKISEKQGNGTLLAMQMESPWLLLGL